MYTSELFGGVRDHHVGLDLGGPVGTPVHAFGNGVIEDIALNDEDGSYGPRSSPNTPSVFRLRSEGRLGTRCKPSGFSTVI